MAIIFGLIFVVSTQKKKTKMQKRNKLNKFLNLKLAYGSLEIIAITTIYSTIKSWLNNKNLEYKLI